MDARQDLPGVHAMCFEKGSPPGVAYFVTFTLTFAVFLFDVATATTQVPALTAVTRPSADTVATFFFEDFHLKVVLADRKSVV